MKLISVDAIVIAAWLIDIPAFGIRVGYRLESSPQRGTSTGSGNRHPHSRCEEAMINTFTGPKEAPATIRDVARLAAVSTATVSRVGNDTDDVSGQTRTGVLAAIAKLEYRPDAHAAQLGRANGGLPRKCDIHVPVSVRP
jgi:hypothetical protein